MDKVSEVLAMQMLEDILNALPPKEWINQDQYGQSDTCIYEIGSAMYIVQWDFNNETGPEIVRISRNW